MLAYNNYVIQLYCSACSAEWGCTCSSARRWKWNQECLAWYQQIHW